MRAQAAPVQVAYRRSFIGLVVLSLLWVHLKLRKYHFCQSRWWLLFAGTDPKVLYRFGINVAGAACLWVKRHCLRSIVHSLGSDCAYKNVVVRATFSY